MKILFPGRCAIKTTKTPARIMLVSKIVRPQDRLKRGLKQAIKALLGRKHVYPLKTWDFNLLRPADSVFCGQNPILWIK